MYIVNTLQFIFCSQHDKVCVFDYPRLSIIHAPLFPPLTWKIKSALY